MARYILIAAGNPLPGRDTDFNDWYDAHHIQELCSGPGFVSGERFEGMEESLTPLPGKYLTIYEMDTADPSGALMEAIRRTREGEYTGSDAVDSASAKMWIYKPYTPAG